MPYDETGELPDSVRNSLPQHAQEIFLAAYNSAWDQYKSPGKRKDDASREETAIKVAWAAVKNEYKRVERGYWVKKKGSE